MSNSSLICWTKISPNSSYRSKKITKITLHHAASCGTIESMGNYFALSSSGCSANYGIDSSGRIALYVPENRRAWTSSNADNDSRAITVEIANCAKGGDWPVSDKALEATIQLCVDICKRNGINGLNFTGNKNGNLTQHCYFASTACPGPYLKSKFPYIAEEVNRRLGVQIETKVEEAKFKLGDEVKLVSGAKYFNGKSIPGWVFNKTLYVRAINGDRVTISTLKSGAITGSVDAKYLAFKNGKPVVESKPEEPKVENKPVVEEKPVVEIPALKLGDTVKLIPGATYYNGKSIPSWVFKKTLYVRKINGENITISYLKTGAVTGTVDKDDLVKV